MAFVQQVVLGVGDMHRAVRFWCQLLNYRPIGEGDKQWTMIAPIGGDGIRIGLQRSTAAVQEFPRVHLDLGAHGAAELDDLADCVERLGGERVDWPLYPLDPDFVVLADTEGNRFCVVDVDRAPAPSKPTVSRQAVQ